MDDMVSCEAVLWRWAGGKTGERGVSWFFLTITGEQAEALAATALMRRLEGLGRGFGSLRVTATIGETTWQTSVFPQKSASGAAEWLLPVKAAVRRSESLAAGDAAVVELRY